MYRTTQFFIFLLIAIASNAQSDIDCQDFGTCMTLGTDHLTKGTYEKAINVFSKTIKLAPKNGAGYANRGIAYMELGQYDKSLADLKKANKFDKKNPIILMSLALVHKGMSNYSEAQKYFEKTIDVKPDYTKAYYNLANMLVDEGKTEEAMNQFNKSISIKPTYLALLNRGLLYQKQRDFEKALMDYDNALSIDSLGIAAYSNKGNVFADQGAFLLAIEEYTRAIDINPNYASGYFNRAISKKIMYDRTGACEDWKKAAELGMPQAKKAYEMECSN